VVVVAGGNATTQYLWLVQYVVKSEESTIAQSHSCSEFLTSNIFLFIENHIILYVAGRGLVRKRLLK